MAKKPILPESDGRYLKIISIARRAKQLSKSGGGTSLYSEGNFDPVEVAAEELRDRKLRICRRDEKTMELEDFA